MKRVLLLPLFLLAFFLQGAHGRALTQRERLDSIRNAANECAENNQWQKAYALAAHYCSLCDTADVSLAYIAMLGLLEQQAYEEGRDRDADEINLRIRNARRLAKERRERLDSIFSAANKCSEKGQWPETYALAARYCDICDTATATAAYGVMLGFLAQQASEETRHRDAVKIGERMVEVRRRAFDGEPRHVATGLNDLAVFCHKAGDDDAAIKHCFDALDIFKAHPMKNDMKQAVTLANMAAFLSSRNAPGDDSLSAKCSEIALDHIKKDTREYMNALGNLAAAYAKIGNFTKADEISRKALKDGKKVYAGYPADYAAMLANCAVRLANRRAYTSSLQYADEAEAHYKEAGQTNTIPFAKMLVNKGVVLIALERYDESVGNLEKARTLLADLVPCGHADNVRCLSELATAYDKKGDAEKTDSINNLIATCTGGTSGISPARKAHLLVKQAEIAAGAGNYKQAIRLEQTAISHFRSLNDIANEAVGMGNLANYHIATKNYDAAIDSISHAVGLLSKTKGNETVSADLLSSLAMAYHYKGNSDSAQARASEAVELYRSIGDTLTTAYSNAIGNFALYTYIKGDTARALTLAEEAKERQLAALGDDHPDNAALFYNLARYYCGIDPVKVQRYYHRAYELQTSVVRSNFSHLTTAERENFYNTKSYLFKAAPVLAYMHRDNDSILADAYNAQLLTKGLLLNSEINFRQFLQQTGDSTLLDSYERIELLNREITAAYDIAPERRAERIAAAQAEAANLEKQLIRDCKPFGNFMAGLDGDLRKVSSALKDDEMAIEVMNLNVGGLGDTYLALYLRRGWQSPRCKVMFSAYDLEQLGYTEADFSRILNDRDGINTVYGDPNIGAMVWGKLLPELEGVSTVYFAPAGMFYQLGVENLRIDSLSTFADRYECYRLSSTRLLADRESAAPDYASASIFGGLKYDMTSSELSAAHESFKDYVFDSRENDLAMAEWEPDAAEIGSQLYRDGVDPLPGTFAEAERIGEILMQKNIPTNMFEDEVGTEEAFKALSGKKQSIIHIATHGFALSDSGGNTDGKFDFRIADIQQGDALSRCGLLLSGANFSIKNKGGKLPRGIENGVLTAREISMLDLSGAQLVALSACRTGVGEVRDDGVFGLQRGFKKAGASTLLMSLWKVNDEATKTMMTAFYEALIDGDTKRDAFAKAQGAVKAAGFDKPFYWASFIMLDGL